MIIFAYRAADLQYRSTYENGEEQNSYLPGRVLRRTGILTLTRRSAKWLFAAESYVSAS